MGILDKLVDAFAEVQGGREIVTTLRMSARTLAEIKQVSYPSGPMFHSGPHSIFGARVDMTRMEDGLVEVCGDGGTKHLALLWGDEVPTYFVSWARPKHLRGVPKHWDRRGSSTLENWIP